MTGEQFMTPTDVAEILGFSLPTVLEMIDSGDIVATRRRGWKIEHSEVARVILEMRRSAFDLGEDAPVVASFVLSRPIEGDEFD